MQVKASTVDLELVLVLFTSGMSTSHHESLERNFCVF